MDPLTLDSPHTKTHLLLQAHFSRAALPIADYLTDTKSVLDQALRILQVGRPTLTQTQCHMRESSVDECLRQFEGTYVLGCGVLKVGCGVLKVGCGVLKVGCGVLKVGCGVLKVGCGVLKVGCGI